MKKSELKKMIEEVLNENKKTIKESTLKNNIDKKQTKRYGVYYIGAPYGIYDMGELYYSSDDIKKCKQYIYKNAHKLYGSNSVIRDKKTGNVVRENSVKIKASKLKEIINEQIKKRLIELAGIDKDKKHFLNEGAVNLIDDVKIKNPNKLKKWFKELQDKEKRYYGENPYGGNWSNFSGLIISSHSFPNTKGGKEKAEEYIKHNTDKWGPAMAVPIKAKSENIVGYVVGGWVAE